MGPGPFRETIAAGESLKHITLSWDACHPDEEANLLTTQIEQVSQKFRDELTSRYSDPTQVIGAYILVAEHWSSVSLCIHGKAPIE